MVRTGRLRFCYRIPFQSNFSELELFISGNPELAELLRKGREGEELTPTDKLRLSVFYGNVLVSWQVTHFQYLSGALGGEPGQMDQNNKR